MALIQQAHHRDAGLTGSPCPAECPLPMLGDPASHLGQFSKATSCSVESSFLLFLLHPAMATMGRMRVCTNSPGPQGPLLRGRDKWQAQQQPLAAPVVLHSGGHQGAKQSARAWLISELHRPIWGCLSQPEDSWAPSHDLCLTLLGRALGSPEQIAWVPFLHPLRTIQSQAA